MSGHLIGIDGGGSKTAFALCDREGRVLSRCNGDTSNYNQVGFEGVTAVLGAGVAALWKAAGLPAEGGLAGVVLGIGGVGEIAAEMPPLRAAVGAALRAVPHHLVNDAEVGWAGALALSPGINVIAGTGSLAFGVDATGRRARAGGWAWAIGDEGSAHWLARRILHIFSRQSDGRLPRTALYDCVRERLGVAEDVEVRFLPMRAPRKQVAALSTILLEVRRRGDETATALYREAAEELALHVRGLRSQLDFAEPVTVSGTGGVFNLDRSIRPLFAAALARHGASYAEPRAAPVEGALMLAAERFAPSTREVIRERLLREHPYPLPEPRGPIAHAE